VPLALLWLERCRPHHDLLPGTVRAWFSLALCSVDLLTGSSRSLPTKSFMVLNLPLSKTNTSNKAWGDAVLWLRMRLVWGLRVMSTVTYTNMSSQNCIQAHDNMLEVLPHINLYLSTRRPQNIGFPGHAGTGFFLSKMDSIFSTKNIVFRSKDGGHGI